jgi:hypothetical protein
VVLTSAASTATPRRRFVAGTWLVRSLTVCGTRFPQLLVATSIVMVPMFVLEWALTRGPTTRIERAFSPILIRVFFQSIEAGVGFVVQGIVAMLVLQELRKRTIRSFHSIRLGLSRLRVLLGIVVCVVLAFAACAIPVGILTWSVPWLIFLILLAITPYVVWFVASTAAVVERLGVIRSLARSAGLTKGRRLQIFAAFVASLLLAAAVCVVIDRVCELVLRSPAAVGRGPEESLRDLVVRGVGALLGGMLGSVLPVVIYHDLRTTAEGPAIPGSESSAPSRPEPARNVTKRRAAGP